MSILNTGRQFLSSSIQNFSFSRMDFKPSFRSYSLGSNSSSNFEEEKQKYLNLSLDKKRKVYKCGQNFHTIEDVDKYTNIGRNLSKDPTFQDDFQGSIYKVDQNLNKKIGIFFGNIAALEVDAIVNAANNSLLGGGGVDAVIHRAAGPNLLDECRTLKGCDTGEAKITGGYLLPAKYVIHTVGPMGENQSLLEKCYVNSLHLAVENNLKTIAFPCVSTGVYGYPNKEAAKVVLQTVRTFLESNHKNIELIVFCLFMDVDKDAYSELLPYYFPLS
ncbi:UNVERIFIED_CONTAM: hypothetical protein RMT77_001699 [Armadillidium vulgare]